MKESEEMTTKHNFETTDFYALDREGIVNIFEKILKECEIEKAIKLTRKIEPAYREKKEKRDQQALKKFKKEGGYEPYFEPPNDQADSKFKELYNLYTDRKNKHVQEVKAQEKQNVKEKEALLDALKALVHSEDHISKTYKRFNEINDQWKVVKIKPSKKTRQLYSDYQYQIELFFHNMQITKDLKELDLEKHLEQKREILTDMESLLAEKTIKKLEQKVRSCHSKWSAIGPVPSENKNEVIKRFKKINDAIFNKVEAHYEKLQKKGEANLKVKEQLCEQVEELNKQRKTSHKEWQSETKKVLNIQKQWKKAGRVPQEDNDAIWERFRTACDFFFEDKQRFYNSNQQRFEANKKRKETLCEQAEELKESKEWETTSETLINLQKDWKNIAYAGPKDDQDLYKRFRAACDAFFNARKAFNKEQEKAKEDNLGAKDDLIKKLNSLKASGNPKEDLATIEAFMDEWKAAGEVPKKKQGELYKAYAEGVQQFYDSIKMDETEKELAKFKAKAARIARSPNPDHFKQEEKNLSRKLKELNEAIVQYENNLGFFANSNKANALKQEVEKNLESTKVQQTLLDKKMAILKKEKRLAQA